MINVLIPKENLSIFRGGGRYIQTLKENLGSDFQFITDTNEINQNDCLIVSQFNPFAPPAITKRYCKKQLLIVFDIIPLKYPHHFPIGIKGKINLFRNKLSLKNFDKIITISEHAKKDISTYLKYPGKKIAVIYPKLAKIFNDRNIPVVNIEDNKYCIYVGDVNWNKNLKNLVQAIKLANVQLLLVGKPFCNDRNINELNHPWQKEYREILIDMKNDDRFKLLGYQSDNDLINLYKNAYLNILISRDEGFGYSFMEAASQTCPSLLADNEVFHEISNESAFFTPISTPQEIANTITQIYSNQTQRDSVAILAKKQFDIFSEIDINLEFKKLIEE